MLARPAIADTTPLRIGWLAALTGASSSTGVAMDRGLVFGVNEINAAGGVNGRQLELIIRDTQSDPTKAVNAAVELTHRSQVNLVFGPANSGEALAVTGLLARGNIPQLDPCWVDTLIDVVKYPMAFRTAPSNQQIGAAANHYVLDVMKIRDVALISDTTGYGTASVQAYEPMLKQKGANVVYQASIEASQPDLMPDMLRMRNAGAKVIMPWSVNAGFLARILNTRGQMGWDVPVAGQTTLGSGQTKALLEKPEYWENDFQIGFRTTNYGADGRLQNAGYLDYRVPVCSDLPMIDTQILEIPNPNHPYGVRGVGETSIVPPLAAIGIAVSNATGVRLNHIPMSPPRILAALD